jgi:hypothetical protein
MTKPVEAPGAESTTMPFATVDEIATAMQNRPELVKEYKALGEDAFLKKHLKQSDAPEVPDGTPAPDAPQDDLAKAKADLEERERIIRELNEGTIPTMQDRIKSIEDENAKLQEQLKVRKAAESDIDIDLPDIGLDDMKPDDLFDPEKGQKVLNSFKTLADTTKKLASELKAVKAGVQESEARVSIEEKRRENLNAKENERSEIDRIRKSNPELFNGKRELAKVEDDYINFMSGLGRIIGFKGQVVDPASGQFAPEISAAYQQYHDEKSGAELKKKAEASGLKMPEDFDDLLLVHQLREVRTKNLKRDTSGQVRPWSFSEALEYYVAKQPLPEDTRLIEARRKKEAEARAIKNRESFARELPASGGSNPVDLTTVTDADFARKLNEYRASGSEEAKTWIETVCRMSNMQQTEIDGILKRTHTTKKKG